METSLLLIVFLASLLLGVTISSIYSSFGPNSKILTDPFQEHED